MRIGYVIDEFPKTSETFIYNEVLGLNEENKIRIFSLKEGGRDLDKRLDVVYGKKSFRGGIGALSSLIKSELFDKSSLEIYYKMLAEYFEKYGSDIDMLHRHFSTNSVVYYLSEILEVPYTVTTHAWDIFSNDRYKHLKKVLKGANRVVTISNYNKNYLVKNFDLNPDKIDIVRMGIDIQKFKPSPSKGEIRNILTVARLVEKKGIEYGLKAIYRLKEDYPDIQYNIVGTGPLIDELKNLVKSYNLTNNVNLLGRVSEERLIEEYEKSDVFLLPCIIAEDGDRDGIPVVLMEAMAMEKLVISTKVSGVPELISHGENGLLVEPKSVDGLASMFRKLLDENISIKKIGKSARRKVKEDFNLDDQVSTMKEIFKGVVESD